MRKEISSIIIAVIFSATALYGIHAFTKVEATYATVNFTGGFKKIGQIAEQRRFSNARVSLGENIIHSGSIAEVIPQIQRSLANNEDPNTVVWNDGVQVVANTGIAWIGSQGNFDLVTDSINLASSEASPLSLLEVIQLLENMDSAAKETLQKTAAESLTFSTY